jgi:hypothetical protein
LLVAGQVAQVYRGDSVALALAGTQSLVARVGFLIMALLVQLAVRVVLLILLVLMVMQEAEAEELLLRAEVAVTEVQEIRVAAVAVLKIHNAVMVVLEFMLAAVVVLLESVVQQVQVVLLRLSLEVLQAEGNSQVAVLDI